MVTSIVSGRLLVVLRSLEGRPHEGLTSGTLSLASWRLLPSFFLEILGITSMGLELRLWAEDERRSWEASRGAEHIRTAGSPPLASFPLLAAIDAPLALVPAANTGRLPLTLPPPSRRPVAPCPVHAPPPVRSDRRRVGQLLSFDRPRLGGSEGRRPCSRLTHNRFLWKGTCGEVHFVATIPPTTRAASSPSPPRIDATSPPPHTAPPPHPPCPTHATPSSRPRWAGTAAPSPPTRFARSAPGPNGGRLPSRRCSGRFLDLAQHAGIL